MKSRNLLFWQMKVSKPLVLAIEISKPLVLANESLETSCLGKLLISWFNPQALTQLSGGSKIQSWSLRPLPQIMINGEGHSYNRNVNHSYKGRLGMVKGIYLAYKYTVATSKLISLPRLLWYFVWPIDFYIVVMLSGLLFTRRVPTNKPFPFPLCHVLL